MSLCQFEGAPCLRHSSYVFYKAFKYKYDYHNKVLTLGDFFFLKILKEIPICIGEVELLWEDKASNQFLTSLRLYFRPEHTPNGRQDDTGQDEVIALGERLVIKLDDLVPLIQHDIKWMYGCSTNYPGSDKSRDKNGDILDGCEKGMTKWRNCGSDDVKNGIIIKDEHRKKRNFGLNNTRMDSLSAKNVSSGAANLAVMSYPRYCRYRAIQKRLEGCDSEWIHLAVVVAIGGFSGRAPACRVMFCRDTFYQPEIDDLDIRMDHMLPVLKGRTKGKKTKQLSRKDSQQDSDSMEEMFAHVTPSVTTSTRPRRLTESSELSEEKVSTEEQAFLIGLHKFMHDAKMPIGRIPSLGFKQIDLYYFYKQAEKIGGYDSITHKRMWKHLYDKLGGNSSNTSAATCTRKHYERLLLPYERHLRKLKMGKVKKKHQKQVENRCHMKVKVHNDNSHTSVVDVKEDKDVKVKLKTEVIEEVHEQDTKKDERLLSTEISQNTQNECPSTDDKSMPSVTEHSKPADLQSKVEVLEIPVVRHDTSNLPVVEATSVDSGNNVQHVQRSQTEKPQHPQQAVKDVTGLTSAQSSSAFVLGESPALPYANMVPRGGYLIPVLPQHILHTTWGMKTPPSSSSATTPQIRAESVVSQPVVSFKDHLNTSLPLSSKANQDSCTQDIRNKPSTKKPSVSSHLSSSLDNNVQNTAHTKTPYKPSPPVLNDQIQPVCKSSYSSHFSPSQQLANSSQQIAPVLHPKPPGHKSQSHLPPAPTTIYLHPSSTNPYTSIQSSIITPPPAHCHPRKRVYPFNNPVASATGVFPSPDMVLNRIRNSTGLPRSSTILVKPLRVPQRFEDPRKIFTQTAQSVTASQNVSLSQRKESHSQQELTSGKLSNTKSKNTKKCQQAYTVYSHMSPPEAQQAFMQGHMEQRHPNNTKVVDQMKPASNLNGLISAHQTSKSVTSVLTTNPVPSSSKDGRLASALFGTQFTALPRTTKPSELTHPQPYMGDPSSAAIAAMSLNPHLHPAFISPYLPLGSTAATAALNPQFQMLASALASPAQLAAYEEMLRQNGHGAFITAAAQGKLSKKN